MSTVREQLEAHRARTAEHREHVQRTEQGRVRIETYISDYDGSRRWCLRVNGSYPFEYDFSTQPEAVDAYTVITAAKGE